VQNSNIVLNYLYTFRYCIKFDANFTFTSQLRGSNVNRLA